MGWASGFQAGTQLAKAALEAEQRRRLQEVANEQATQQYTPEQGAEMQRIAGLQTTNAAGETVPQFQFTAQPGSTAYGLQKFNVDTGAYEAVPSAGVGSAAYQVTPKQQLFGQAYDQLSEDQIRGLRMGKMADVIAETDPIKAQQLRSQQAEQEHLAKMRPMQVEAAELGLKKGRREDTEETNYSAFTTFASENPDMPAEQLRKAAREQFKLTPDQETKYIANRLQLREIDLKNFTLDVQDAIKGKNLSQLKTLYNTDPRFDDKTDIDVVPGKNGQVTVKFIDKASGNVLRTNGFGSEALAIEYLGKQATDPMNTGSWLLGVQAKQASIEASQAGAARDRASIGQAKAGNMVDVVDASGNITQVDRARYMNKDGVLELPKGMRLYKEVKDVKPIHITSEGLVTQGDQIVGKNQGGAIVPVAKNPWASDPKTAATWEQQGVRIVSVKSAAGPMVWGYTSGGDVYDRPEDALVELEQRRKPVPPTSRITVPAPSGRVYSQGLNTSMPSRSGVR